MPPIAASLLTPNVGLIFWTLIVFGLLIALLSKYAWKPVAAALSEREQSIDASIRRAEAALAEAKQIQSDNDRARREAEADARRMLTEARTAAETTAVQEREKMAQQLNAMKAQAQADIDRQKQSLKEELRAEVVDLAMQAAEKILRERIDAPKQRELVDGFLATLPAQQN